MNRLDAFDRLPANPTAELDLSSVWQAYVVSRDEALRNRLLVHYLPISRMIARHLHGRMPASVELDDLAQAATLGLRSAIATYDPSRGIPFEHYCGPRVRGAVLDHLRSLDWAPRMLRSRVQRIQEMTRQIEMQTGRQATADQLSSALHISITELQALQGETAAPVRVRISTGDADQDTVNLDMIADDSTLDPEREAQRADLRAFLVKGLSPVERQVVMLYYYDNQSLREIGESLELCESRVSQIHQGVIKRLRERMHRIGATSIDE